VSAADCTRRRCDGSLL